MGKYEGIIGTRSCQRNQQIPQAGRPGPVGQHWAALTEIANVVRCRRFQGFLEGDFAAGFCCGHVSWDIRIYDRRPKPKGGRLWGVVSEGSEGRAPQFLVFKRCLALACLKPNVCLLSSAVTTPICIPSASAALSPSLSFPKEPLWPAENWFWGQPGCPPLPRSHCVSEPGFPVTH